jgi:2,4-diketo-3-deoxy-L-fuconate hydrolase
VKLCHFDDGRLGVVRDGSVHDVTAALTALPASRWPHPRHDPLVLDLERLRPVLGREATSVPGIAPSRCLLRSPVPSPGKIIAVRRNYGRGTARPDFFVKATSSVAGPGEGLLLPLPRRRYQVEIELAVVVGRAGRSIGRDVALDHVAGFCIALDVSMAGREDRGWRKSADTFCVLGPWLTTADEVRTAETLGIELDIDGRPALRGATSGMHHDVAALLAAASRLVSLEAGDVLLTGSPGRQPLRPGAVLDCRIESLGSMRVEVAARR